MRVVQSAFGCLLVSIGLLAGEERELHTNAYIVPPTFLSTENGGPPPTAIEVLESAGISFPKDASAVYNKETSQLIVRNTQEQMELVDAFIDSFKNGVEKQIYLTFREITVPVGVLEELGTNWLVLPPQPDPVPGNATIINSLEDFQEELSRPPAKLKPAEKEDGVAIAVLSDPQFQVLIRALKQSKGVDLVSPPSVMARSGQAALSQLGNRRFGAIPVLGADEYTVDLELFLPEHGEALFEPGDPLETQLRVTLWDGQTVAIGREGRDGLQHVIFVRAQLMDPAGLPTEDQEGQAKPEPDVSKEMNARISELFEKTHPHKFRFSNTRVVKADETFSAIAHEAGSSVSEIKRLNGLESDVLEVGQLLFVPKVGRKGSQHSLLNEVQIPGLKFTEVSLVEALGFIQETLLTQKNVEEIFPDEAPRVILKNAGDFEDTTITLQVEKLPVREALRFITELAGCEYEIRGSRIYVFARSE